MTLFVLGIDPGPTTGMLLAGWEPGIRAAVVVQAFECDAGSAPVLLAMLMNTCGAAITAGGMEQFRSGPRSQRLRGTRADSTRDLIRDLADQAGQRGLHLAVRPAATVKPWATDPRLERAGLLAPTAGLRDARDAARHSLYTAVHDGGLPDPLSKIAASR